GAPVSHLLDVLVQAKPYLAELGVHVEACANEASAAAMLGASIHYPLRGAVTWKSIVGTNVAADALSNLASPGVVGGALVVVGEDYGEGASVIQERTHAYALKSTLLLLDPRPELSTMVDMVEHAFALSEASNMPAVMVVEEGSPEYIEKDIVQALRRLDVQTPVHGKDLLPAAGEYTVEVMAQGLVRFAERHLPQADMASARDWLAANARRREAVAA